MFESLQHVNCPPDLPKFMRSQFASLPYPMTSFSGQTVIVTGANVGLGLETAKHFVRLAASKVILACRDTEKGEIAAKSINAPFGVVEVWKLDLASYESAKEFCVRAKGLERLDVLVENAGVMLPHFEEAEGMEMTMTVNVISTFLMALWLLPKMQADGVRNTTIPHLVVVSSSAHAEAKFKEMHSPSIFDALKAQENQYDRYNTSKLLEVLVIRELASSILQTKQQPKVIINVPHPGFCVSEILRHSKFLLRAALWIGKKCIARTAEMGSRTIIASAAAGFESHGKYMEDCVVSQPGGWVTSEEGQQVQKKVYRELLGILEGIEPGVTKGFEVSWN